MAKITAVNYTDGYRTPGKLIVDFSFEPAEIGHLFLLKIRYSVARFPSDEGYWNELEGNHEIRANEAVQQEQWAVDDVEPRPPLQNIRFVVQLFASAHYFESERFRA